MEPNQAKQTDNVAQATSFPSLAKPVLFRVIYWIALIEGLFFTLSIIPFVSGRITLSSQLILIGIFENLLFGIPLIIAFFGLRKMKMWGLYSVIFVVVADMLMIATNIDGISRDQGSFITLAIEIIVLSYLIYRFKTPQSTNKWF